MKSRSFRYSSTVQMHPGNEGQTMVTVPTKLLSKRTFKIEVNKNDPYIGEWKHIRRIARWYPIIAVEQWLDEHAGKHGWEMNFSRRQIEIADPNVAFAFKLRWA